MKATTHNIRPRWLRQYLSGSIRPQHCSESDEGSTQEEAMRGFLLLTVTPETPLWETNYDKLSKMSYKKINWIVNKAVDNHVDNS